MNIPTMKDGQWEALPGVDRECFGCGAENVHGLQMRFESDGRRLRSSVTVHPHFRGWSNLAHGGVLSTVLDEMMGWTVIHLTGKFMLTKGMTVAFMKPVRVGARLLVVGYIKEHKGRRRVVAVAEIRDEAGDLCASSEGEFVLFSKEQFRQMEILPEADLEAMAVKVR